MNTLDDVLQRIEKKLKMRDIQRTDLLFADLLNQLPGQFPSLLAATAGLRAIAEIDIEQTLRECLRLIDARISQVTFLKIEQTLSQGVSKALPSPADAQIVALRMGWTDGRMRSPDEVASHFSTTTETVQSCEDTARLAIQTQGLYCPNMLLAVREISGCAPCNNKQLTANLHRLGVTGGFLWHVDTFLAAADLLRIPHALNLVDIGRSAYLSAIKDPSYPEKVVTCAHQAASGGRRATLAEVASAVSAVIDQPLKNRDIRAVVATLDGVKFHGNARDSFSFRY